MMNTGKFGLNRTGHGGAGRENNYNAARNYLKSFLQSRYVQLISPDDDVRPIRTLVHCVAGPATTWPYVSIFLPNRSFPGHSGTWTVRRNQMDDLN